MNGTHRWSERYGGSNIDNGYGVAVNNKTGATLLTGTYEDTVDFGAGNVTSNGSLDIYLLNLPP